MRHQILTTALGTVLSVLAYGQNFNPTVEVTNAYEGGASAIQKPAQKMAVPDSVLTFNLDFDYSVFEKPYQGAYEFKPYHVQLRPAPTPSTENSLYLKIGAGYTLRPELDLVWTPLRRDRVQVDVYARHHSYFGRYHKIDALSEEAGSRVFKPTGEKAGGFLADTRVGVDGSYGWDGGQVTADVSWQNRLADDYRMFRRLNGLNAKARVRSLVSDAPHFLYDAAVDYHFYDLSGSWNTTLVAPGASDFTESRFALDGSFGPVFGPDSRLLVDLGLTLVRYGGYVPGYTGGLSVTPKYEFALDDWRFSLGARLASIIYSDDWPEDARAKTGFIFPAVHVDWHLLDDRLVLQAAATGGDRVNARSDAFLLRPFALPSDFSHSLERVRAMLGVRGSVSGRFRYDLQGGYARWSRAPMDCFVLESEYYPALSDAAFNLVFAELDYGWKSESVTVDGKIAYRWTNVSQEDVFAPAAFTGWIRPAWHWGDRFTAGLDAGWSTRRHAMHMNTPLDVPGWVDLGLFADFQFTRHFGFWLKAGNLLDQAIQRTPLHAEAGMYLTGGLCLTF